MASRIARPGIDANDPRRLVRCWASVLGRRVADDGTTLLPTHGPGFPIRFLGTQAEKSAQNRMHFELTTTSLGHPQRTVRRALDLGARHVDVGQRPEEGHGVLADPEGNEFSVLSSLARDTDAR